MASRASDLRRSRTRWLAVIGAVAVSALIVTASATSTGASGESSTTDESSTSSTVGGDTSTTDETSTTTGDSSTSTDASTSSTAESSTTAVAGATTAPAGTGATASSEEFTATLASECEGDTGQALLADALQGAVGTDGSNRIVEIVRTCDIEFVGAVDEALGRPATNVEALIADPANNVTPNQAQLDLLNAELAIYWRIADAWAQTQVTATSVPGESSTASSAPASDVSTSTPGESSTTGA
jgi:hypothetical protein